jgi:hypothetical protein
MKVKFQTNPSEWTQAVTDAEKKEAEALTKAMRDTVKQAVDVGRKAIQAGGFSSKFANSLVGKIPSKFTLDPSGYIHTTINYADVFEHGATIAGKPFIWLPLPAVPPGHGRPHLTPKQYVQEVGALVTLHRAGKPPMLAARVRLGQFTPQPGRFVGIRRLRRGASGPGIKFTMIPMFVGVPSIAIPPKFDVIGAIKAMFDDTFEENYKKESESV